MFAVDRGAPRTALTTLAQHDPAILDPGGDNGAVVDEEHELVVLHVERLEKPFGLRERLQDVQLVRPLEHENHTRLIRDTSTATDCLIGARLDQNDAALEVEQSARETEPVERQRVHPVVDATGPFSSWRALP